MDENVKSRLAQLLAGEYPPPAAPSNSLLRLLSAPTQAPLGTPSPYARQGGNYNTQLGPLDELAFRSWVQQNNVPFNPGAGVTDYDMRGFYKALQAGDPRATSAVNPNDNKMHYPDHWKTPYHQTFSQDSQWAGPVAPRWNEQDQLVSPGGRILHDERAPPPIFPFLK